MKQGKSVSIVVHVIRQMIFKKGLEISSNNPNMEWNRMRQSKLNQNKQKMQSCTTHDNTVIGFIEIRKIARKIVTVFIPFFCCFQMIWHNLHDFKIKLYSESCDCF